MHIQTIITTKKVVNGEAVMKNDRYMDFLKFALHRIIETAVLYETQAKVCKDSTNKLFLYYLAGKKRVQHVVLEMIATDNRGKPMPFSDYNEITGDDENKTAALAQTSAEAIMTYAHQRAEKDLNLYTSLAVLEEDLHTKKLLITLSKLAKDFIQDISSGYSKFVIKRVTHSPYSPKVRIREKAIENAISN